VGGHIIWTGFVTGIILRISPLAWGSVIQLCLIVHALGVNMGWLGCGRGNMGELLRQVCPRVIDVSRWFALGKRVLRDILSESFY